MTDEQPKSNKKPQGKSFQANEDAGALGTNAQGTPVPKKPKKD